MESQEHISSNATSSQSRDPGNKYGRADVNDKNIWYCNFCQKKLSGGVHRFKQHLAGGFRNASKCLKCPVEVRQEIILYMKEKAETKSSNQIMPDLSQYDNDECDEEEVDVESRLSIKRKRQTKGPMDMFITKKKAQGTSGKQAEINKVCEKALRDKACADVAKFFYDAGIAFNAATYPSFQTMIESIDPASDARTGRAPTEEEMHQLFLPYRGFCARKGIDAKEVVLHDIEVSSALIEYITTNLIGCIVCGGSNRNVLTRKLKAVDVPTSLGKLAPEYCAVYVVSKAKVQAMRTMESRSAPSASESAAPNSMQMPNSPRASTSSSLASTSTFNSKASPPHPLMQYTPIQNQYSSESTYNSWMSTSSDNSGYGNERLSIDQMSEGDTPRRMPGHGFPSQRKLTKIPGLNTSSITNRSSFDQFSFTDKSEDSAPNSFVYRGGYGHLSNNYSNSHSSKSSLSTSSSSSMACTQEVEDEMQRLRLQLQQNMETLKYFDDEANIKQKMAKELEADKIYSLDLEKHKQKVSKEVACISEQLAEIETRARNVKNIKYDEKENDDIQYRKFTLEDIEIATDYFSASQKVGEGGYGPVYKGELDNTKVAIKVLRPDVSQGLVQFKKEVEVLGRMKHPNLVLLLGACPEYGCLVYELMDYGSLEDRLFRKDNTPPIPWRIRFKIASQIATALHFLHSTKPEPLVHRDLKPANILLDQNFVPKICDVGLARLVPPAAAENMTQYHMTAAAGTFFYIDPEYQQTGLLSVKSDIYSLGVVFLQILTGRPAMGLSHAVDNAIEEGKFAGILDQSVDGWPIEDALIFARLALRCCELRKRDRPDLGSEVLPELDRLSAYAISDTTSTSISSMSYEDSSCNSPYAGNSWMSQAKSPS